jgi:hypothetical protein
MSLEHCMMDGTCACELGSCSSGDVRSVLLPEQPFALKPPFSKKNPPPGHGLDVFSLPRCMGNVSVALPGDYPTPREFYRVYAPAGKHAEMRSPECEMRINEVCGPCGAECRLACFERLQSEGWWSCVEVGHGKPLLLRGLARGMPAFKRWSSDEALANAYAESWLKAVDVGHARENRKHRSKSMSVRDFVAQYKQAPSVRKHMYAVTPLPAEMAADVHLPPMARCGGAARRVFAANLWMGSGGTKSVLHEDASDNFNW